MSRFAKKICMTVLVGVALAGGAVFAGFQNAMAAGSTYNKALASSVISCYEANQFKTPLSAEDFRFRTTSTSNFMKGSQKVFVPSGFDGDNMSMKCTNFVSKLLSKNGTSIPTSASNSSAISSFMTGLGYSSSATESSGECISFTYNITGDNYKKTVNTQKLCASVVNSDGTIGVDNLEILNQGDTEWLSFTKAKNGSVTVKCKKGGCGKHTFTKGSTNWNSFVNEIKNEILVKNGDFGYAYSDGTTYRVVLDGLLDGEAKINRDTYGEASAKFSLAVNENSLKTATGTLTGASYGSKPTFTDGEQFVLYQNYLLEYFDSTVYCDWTADQITANSSKGYSKVRLYKNGEFKTCYVKAGKNANKSVGGIDGNHKFGSSCNYSCIVSWLRDSTVTSLPEDPINPNEGPNINDSEEENNERRDENLMGDLVDCNELTTVGAMQWILCPTMNNMEYTASWVDEMTQSWLEVKTDIYGGGGTVENVWSVIRNIANALMIVFLSIIIFSQLTGYGIDNYGIKKMLPRLIVMAILINLSFYICQLAIDLSNIAGVGLRNMFGSIGMGVSDSNLQGTTFIGTMITGIFASASVGGPAAVGAGVALAGLGVEIAVAVIIAVIVLLLVVLVAVMILFLMLGAREVIIILCIVLAPLAFAAFILPNTQNLFKKWWELFKAAIIIFPICGALSGISYMLRSMAASGTELEIWGFAILLILPYLGFFLMPMLLKNAISALGKVGGALTSLGNTMRNGGRAIGQGAARVAQKTEGYKNLQTEAARKRQSESSQRTINRLEALKKQREAEGGQLSERDSRRLYEARQTQNKLRMEQAMADAGAVELSGDVAEVRAMSTKEAQEFKGYTDQYSVLTRPDMTSELASAVNAYSNDRSENNATRLQAAIATAESRGMNQEMLKHLGGLELSAGNANDAKILGRMAGSSNKVISQYGKQMGKPANVAQNLSMDQFASSTGPVKMSEAFANQGTNVLNNMDDDTLEYIKNNGRAAASSDMLVNAATNTTNQKELRQINEMLANANADNINFSGRQLASFDNTTLQTLASRIKKDSPLQQKFITATNDIANSPELMGSLRPEQRSMFDRIRKGYDINDNTFASRNPGQNSNQDQHGADNNSGQGFNDGAGI